MRRLCEAGAELSRSWVRGNLFITPTLVNSLREMTDLPLQGGGELVWTSPCPATVPIVLRPDAITLSGVNPSGCV